MDERTDLGDLPKAWRERAKLLRDYGAEERAAKLWETAAAELEAALRRFRDESLNLVEAAKVSGYTADYLGALVREGKIPNAGRKNAPRIRRADLPIKDGHEPPPETRRPPARHETPNNVPDAVVRKLSDNRGG